MRNSRHHPENGMELQALPALSDNARRMKVRKAVPVKQTRTTARVNVVGALLCRALFVACAPEIYRSVR